MRVRSLMKFIFAFLREQAEEGETPDDFFY